MSEHTPVPWYASPAGKNYWITTKSGLDETIACLAGTDPEGWPREANAKFLVRAANNHARLVEVLAESARQIEYLHGKFQETGTGNAVLAKIQAALAEARK